MAWGASEKLSARLPSITGKALKGKPPMVEARLAMTIRRIRLLSFMVLGPAYI